MAAERGARLGTGSPSPRNAAIAYVAAGFVYLLLSEWVIDDPAAGPLPSLRAWTILGFVLLSAGTLFLLLRRMRTEVDGRLQQLVGAEAALRRSEADLEETERRLSERMKEMHVLLAVLSLCNDGRHDLDETLQQVVEALPGAMQEPSRAVVRLAIGDRHFTSRPVVPATGASFRVEIAGGTRRGLLEVAYEDAGSAEIRPVIVPEEEALLGAVAAELGKLIERQELADVLRIRNRGLAAVPTGICLTGNGRTDRPIIYVNEAFQRITGYSEAELMGRDCRLLQGPDTDEATTERIRRALNGGSSFAGDILNYRKDGDTYWNDLLISPIRDDRGEVTHFVGVMRDVSANRRDQERIKLLESAVEAAASAVIVTNAAGEVEYTNGAFNRITGYRHEELAGRTLRILKSGEHPDAFYEDLWKTISAGRTWRSPIVNRRRDGTNYRASQTIAPIHDSRGRIAHFVAIQEDTTALYEAEEQLRHAQRLQAVGQLTGGIAHDFNNILAVILGNLELLDEQVEDPNLRELLADPLAATSRGAELTKRLLAFARLQPLRPQGVDIAEVVARLRELLQPALTEAIEIRVTARPGLWPAFIDENQLETALLNIALNARDAMPRGGVLSIETENVRLDGDYAARNHEVAAGEYVMITISDTGTGMTPEILAKAFDPFFTTKPLGVANGLGLSMVYGFAKQSGGHVRIESEVGRGTVVRLYVPRAPGPERVAASTEPDRRTDGKGRVIMVVEDDPRVARWITRALESARFSVTTAADAAHALALLDGGLQPDLVLTDIVLPGGTTGIRLAADIGARGSDAAILYMSGYSRDAAEQEGALDPRAPLLTKPFRRAELLREVYAKLEVRGVRP